MATERTLEPKDQAGRAVAFVRRKLIGRRIATSRELHERVGVIKGLAVFASDNISSSAYATEEIMRVLALVGTGALALTLPITLVVIGVLAIVVASYQQTIQAYPNSSHAIFGSTFSTIRTHCDSGVVYFPGAIQS